MTDDIIDKSIFTEELSQHQKDRREARRQDLEKAREKKAQQERQKAKRAKTIKKIILFTFAALVLVVLLFGRLFFQINELKKQRDESQKALNELNEKIEELQSTLDRVTTDEYIEEQARVRFHMIYENEELYVFRNEN